MCIQAENLQESMLVDTKLPNTFQFILNQQFKGKELAIKEKENNHLEG